MKGIYGINKKNMLMGCILIFSPSANADDYTSAGLTPEMLRPNLTNLTPEAASLGKYGAFQVSEYSGTTNISIPLYTVKSGDVSFPIALTYDGSGIKVEQDATMVGLGWNLCYGGVISHIICGEDDFRETSDYPELYQSYWNEKNQTIPQDQPCQSLEFINHPFYVDNAHDAGWGPQNEGNFSIHDRISRGYDAPDIYQACFCGHNVTFIIDKRSEHESNSLYPVVILDDNSTKFNISYEMDLLICGNAYPSTFTITDDRGINYEFRAYSENVISTEHKDSYYLKRIYGPDGINGKSVVTFDYVQPLSISFGTNSRMASKQHQSNAVEVRHDDTAMPNVYDPTFYTLYDRLVNHQEPYSQNIGCDENSHSDKVYPYRIITAVDTIAFNLGTRTDLCNAKSISSITIKPKITGTTRNINFTYDYYQEESPLAGYPGTRLRLTGVSVDAQKYSFEYDNRNIPAFSTYSKDYWGYYNGANPNADKFVACTPAYSISNNMVKLEEHLEGSNRLASESLCGVGMLKRIIYPTGGYTDYEYEIHRFNDKYYYPDANSNISFPQPMNATEDDHVSTYGTSTRINTYTYPQDTNVSIVITACLVGTADSLEIIVRNTSTNNIIKRKVYNAINLQLSDVISLSFSSNISFSVEMRLSATSANQSSTIAEYRLTHESVNSDMSVDPVTSDENGGYSMGGGMRIKTIKNYDSDGTYINGVRYEYLGGKLLMPTVQLEKHYVEMSWLYVNRAAGNSVDGYPAYDLSTKFSFNYANTEPSYLYVCSLGIPATVGYDRVEKKEIDIYGNTLRKTVMDFHNFGYISNDDNTNAINSRMQNTFYFNSYFSNNSANPQGHLNGKIKEEKIYSDTGVLSYVANYTYDTIRQGSVLYPKCFPNFLPGLHFANAYFDLAFFRKFIVWSYPVSKAETFYNSNGNITSSTTTTYSYKQSNYKLSNQTVSDGLNTMRTHFYYPDDSYNNSSGLQYLIDAHNLSEVTAIDSYKNDVFVGGSRYTYTMNANIPVVNRCYSILPPSMTPILEMNVNAWDGYGNIREYTLKNGTPVTVLWSYGHQYPVMEIVGKTYSQVNAIASNSLGNLESQPVNGNINNAILSLHSTLMNGLPDAYVTAITYDSYFNVAYVINPNGYTNVFNYDSYGRLSNIVEPNKGILKRFSYNYKNR